MKDMLRCGGGSIRWGMVLFKMPLLCYAVANILFVLPRSTVGARAWLELLLLGNLLVAYGAGWCLEMLLPRGRQWNISAMGKWVLPAAVAVGILVAQVDTLSLVLIPLPVPNTMSACTVSVPGTVVVAIHGALAGLFAGGLLLCGMCSSASVNYADPANCHYAKVGRWMGIWCVVLTVMPVWAYIAGSLEHHEANHFTPVIMLLTSTIMGINYVLAASIGRIMARTAEQHLTMHSETSLRCLSAGFAIGGGWLIATLDNIIVFSLKAFVRSSVDYPLSLISLVSSAAGLATIEAIPGGLFVGTVVVTLLLARRNYLRHEMVLRETVTPSAK